MDVNVSRGVKNVFNFKDDRKSISYPGTRTASSKDQILTSSGIVSLDSIVGGGLQLGSLFLIEEDEFGVFSKYLLKYFLAEGLTCKHRLFTGSLDCDTHQLVLELPSPADVSEASKCQPDPPGSSEQLRIAWRYHDSPVVQSAPSLAGTTNFGHHFDLTCPFPKEAIDNAEISHWPQPWPLIEDCQDPYQSLLEDLQSQIQRQGHSTQSALVRRTVLRVALHRLGSPLWPDADKRLPHFFYCLRSMVHSALATVMITLPTDFLQQETVQQCEHLSDNVIRLQSLANNSNPLYSEYSGLLNVVKLATLNTIATHVPDTQDWAFKLRKKKFVVEKLHLPPELQDSKQREQDESSGMTCTLSKTSSFDF